MGRKEKLILPIDGSFSDVTKSIFTGDNNNRRASMIDIDPLENNQGEYVLFPLIEHENDGFIIGQRLVDGYINATEICKACGKQVGDYLRLKSVQEFFAALSLDTGIPVSRLTEIRIGNSVIQQGTWVHPQVAINLGQWASPKFAVMVSRWVIDWMQGNVKTKLPFHIERYLLNNTKIPATHFSMLNEMTFALIAPLEKDGYTLKTNMIPDISEGRMFCDWLRKTLNIEPKDFPTYKHEYPNGRIVDAKLYPNKLLGDFREHFYREWIPKKSIKYFEERDPKALSHLNKIISRLPKNDAKELQ